MHQTVTIRELCDATQMDCQVLGNADRVVVRPAPIDDSTPDSVTFYSKLAEHAGKRIGASGAGVVVCTPEAAATLQGEGERTLLLVANPRLAFIRVMNRFFAPPRPVGIHPTAVIHPEAKLGKGVYIGPFTYVGKAEIGDGTVVDGHAHIYDNVRIGCNCTVQAAAVIGSRGFGLERNESGEFEELPHVGGVLIGNDVLVSSGVVIARGTLRDTVIGDGTKIDPLCEISHNVSIGRNCGICASSTFSGSVHIGDAAWVAGGVSVREGVQIGVKSLVGLCSLVLKDVPDGATVYGVPARQVGEQPK